MSDLVKPIRDGLIALLRTIDGGASYATDCSSADSVSTGFRAQPPTLPFIEVDFLRGSKAVVEFVVSEHVQVFTVVGYNDAAGADSGDRADAADSLASDIDRALEANPRLDGLGIATEIEIIHAQLTDYAAYDGQVYQSGASYGRMEGTITVTWRRELGAG